MTSDALSAAHAPSRGLPVVLRTVAIAACLPYVVLKVVWIADGRVGIPDGSVLLEHRTLLLAANTVTLLMDATVVVLALLLTRPWGLRVRPWLLTLPGWAATGLLTPIMVGYPLQLAFSEAEGGIRGSRPFLDEWVFAVVYGGFIAQGLALGGLFLLYTGRRWGHLWRGTVGGLPRAATPPSIRICAVAGAVTATLAGAAHLSWALGSTVGLTADEIARRTADFGALHGSRAAFAAVAAVSVLVLVFRPLPRLPLKPLLGAAWVGASTLAAWGGWLLFAALTPLGGAEPPSALTVSAYAVEMISGLLLSCVPARVLTARRP
ncbi:hypothetical protein [Streptomyces sp. NPDC046887]|uniref:hypothetical protein n=1 Tax=Streptomyces sp. NPDC046887 TaxID=3155472 RepID=UPI0033CCC407